MAGDWIKMRVNLPSDPRVIKVARLLDCSEFTVVGLLHWLWGWADSHTEDGRAVGIDCTWINRQTQTEGFCEALVKVGWLIMLDDGIEIPGFDQHNGASAKRRANTARRVAKHKAKATIAPEPKPVKKAPAAPKGKLGSLKKLLDAEFSHLKESDKWASLSDWMEHLNVRLASPYTERGAKALLKKVDALSADELESAVEFSLEGNYQKLVPPPNYGRNRNQQTKPGTPRFAEYDD